MCKIYVWWLRFGRLFVPMILLLSDEDEEAFQIEYLEPWLRAECAKRDLPYLEPILTEIGEYLLEDAPEAFLSRYLRNVRKSWIYSEGMSCVLV
ncbi:MAG TPA: hypothetical protein VLB83_01645 [Candidatus Paceibacterota bacterium]|nr:hypothetical protein [Candidatus Paceibacterota bacterium]